MKNHRILILSLLVFGLVIPASGRDLFYFLVGDSIQTYDFNGQYQHSFNLGTVPVHDGYRVALTTDGRTAWIGYNSIIKAIEGIPIRSGGVSRTIPVDYSEWLFQGGLAQAGDHLILGRQRFPHPSYWPWYRIDYYSSSSGAFIGSCVSQGVSDSLTWSDGRLAASNGSSGPLTVYIDDCEVLRTINADLYPGNAITGICSTAGTIWVFYNINSTIGHAFDWNGNRRADLDILFQGLAMPTDVSIAWGPDEMNMQVEPAVLPFGDLIQGSSKTLPLRLRNVGNQDLTVSSIGLSNSTHFSYTGLTSATIFVGGYLDIEVTCQPEAPGSLYSELLIASNDPDRPTWTVPLSAEGRPSTVFIDGSRPASGNGQSWATAFKTIPDAMASVAVLNGAELWVKEGTCTLAQTVTIGKSVTLFGGFDGSETSRNQRDWQNHPTILDGNNAVLGLKITAANVTFDGFTVTRGRNTQTLWPDTCGGGIAILASGATIQNCTISGCASPNGYGGGIYATYSILDIHIRNCRFEGNSTSYEGGAIFIYASSSEISDCVIRDNSGRMGGAIYVENSSVPPVIRNCIIQGNQASMNGAIFNNWAGSTIQNCLITGNTGGGIYNYIGAAVITNCTIVDNTLYGIGTGYSDATPVITNSIIWGNTGPQILNDSGANPTITYCDINQDGYGLTTSGDPDAKRNLRKAPRFVDADGPDNTPATWQDNDYRLGNGSYGIDYGSGTVDPVTDLLGNPRCDDTGLANLGTGDPTFVDLGAYERQTNTPLILYVDPASMGSQDGTSWMNAFHTIPEALEASSPSGQVWIKEGPYVLTASLLVAKPLRMVGGFVGTETNPAQRNLAAHTTIIDGNKTVSPCIKITASASLDGLTITQSNGNAEWPKDRGGAVYIDQASPVLSQCRFMDNFAQFGGGAMYAYKSAGLCINCVFLANRCTMGGGGGAAVYNYASRMQFINCLFAANDSTSNAGAMYLQDETAPNVLINCTFAANKAKYSGGAIQANRCSPSLTNCILSGNTASSQPDISVVISGSPTVQYSLVAGTNYGVTNLMGDPHFADPDGPDNDPATWQDNNYHLASDSPCIDSGNNTIIPPDAGDLNGDTNIMERIPLALSGTPRFMDHLIQSDTGLADPPAYPAVADMGAYEYIPGDISGDGSVGLGDMPSIGEYWLATDCGVCGGADLDGDHDVDLQDLFLMIENWLIRPW
ncbi:MAG: right-handed parallel beta-helix repeat-containing protein [Anaerohalosphaeraceae bacterium]